MPTISEPRDHRENRAKQVDAWLLAGMIGVVVRQQ